MARRRRSTLPQVPPGRSLEEAWEEYVRLATHLNTNPSNRHWLYAHELSTFSPRVWFHPSGLYYVPSASHPAAILDAYNRGIFNHDTLNARIELMRNQRPSSPYPSPPTRLAAYVIRFDRHSTNSLAIHSFCWPEAARTFIEMVLTNHPYTWTNTSAIHAPSLDLVISAHNLEEIFDSTDPFTHAQPYPRLAADIAGIPTDDEPAPSRPAKTKTPTTPKTKAPSNLNSITIADIAQSLGIAPSAARATLRKLNIQKPAAGWQWSPDQAPAITAQIKKALT